MTDSQSSSRSVISTGPTFSCGQIAALSGTIASLGLSISFLYDWGYFFALGISFADAPTTISDHARSWLVWLPITAVPILVVVVVHELLVYRGGVMIDDKMARSSPGLVWTKISKLSTRMTDRVIAAAGAIHIVTWVMFGETLSRGFPFLGLFILWCFFIRWALSSVAQKGIVFPLVSIFLYLFPAVVMTVFSSGFSSATSSMENPAVSHRVYAKNAGITPKPMNVRVLRNFEKWLLVSDENKRITWIRLDDINRIELVGERIPFRGLACWLSKRWCLQDSVGR